MDGPDGRWRKWSRGGSSRGPREMYEFGGVESGLIGETGRERENEAEHMIFSEEEGAAFNLANS